VNTKVHLLEEQEVVFTLTRMKTRMDDYDSDPPATLPKLTKQHEYKFRELPSQLFRHLMLERKRKINTLITSARLLAMKISLADIFIK
jgi:hypothetical protein